MRKEEEHVKVKLGVLGLGSVFLGPYRNLIMQLQLEGLAELTTVYDVNADKAAAVGAMHPGVHVASGATQLIESADVDVVLILTSMNEHGALAAEALSAGKHVLVEKPMATSLEEARALVEISGTSKGLLVCAPHVVLSPTYRAMHDAVAEGDIGTVVLARARYGWSGPWWGDWFYRPGGGALFDLGVYNLTSLCGFFGPVRRVCAMVGTAVPTRMSEGSMIDVQAEDNAQVLLDFGDSRFANITTGFTMQKYRGPAIELYGTDGVLQMLGDDWAPDGYEKWDTERELWEVHPEQDPGWPWTSGLRHLVDCIRNSRSTVTRPEHALHCLEVMLAAKRSSEEGRFVDVHSDFPRLDYSSLPADQRDQRRKHDPRTS
jgi:predicted dehydrogenase